MNYFLYAPIILLCIILSFNININRALSNSQRKDLAEHLIEHAFKNGNNEDGREWIDDESHNENYENRFWGYKRFICSTVYCTHIDSASDYDCWHISLHVVQFIHSHKLYQIY